MVPHVHGRRNTLVVEHRAKPLFCCRHSLQIWMTCRTPPPLRSAESPIALVCKPSTKRDPTVRTPCLYRCKSCSSPIRPHTSLLMRDSQLYQCADRYAVLYYPLNVSDLKTSTGLNNIHVYDSATYIVTSNGTMYGLPSDGGVAMGVNGQVALHKC